MQRAHGHAASGLPRSSTPSIPRRHGGGPRARHVPGAQRGGRERGGFSTEVYLACDGRGRLLWDLVTAGQRNEAPLLGALLDAIRVARPAGSPGRPRERPARLLADRGYAHDPCRALLRRRGIPHVIPEREHRDQRERRRRRGSRPPSSFEAEAHRRRNAVERCVKRPKQWRGVATRYEKRAANSFRAMVVIAALMLWLATRSTRHALAHLGRASRHP